MLQLSELPPTAIRFANGLWRHRWVIMAVTWIVALLGWVAVWLLPNQFESRAQVFVQTESILEPVLTGVTARPDYSRRVEVMRLQLLTRPNVQEVILRSGLDEEIVAGNAVERSAKLEAMVNRLAATIQISSPREMYFIISYRNKNPEMARRVVDAVLNMLIEQDLGASLSENQEARRRLDLQIEDYEERLFSSEQRISQFRRANASELSASQDTVRQRAQREAEVLRLDDEIAGMSARIITLQNLMSTTSQTNSDDELDGLRVELADLRSRFEETHPDIRGVIARINQLERAGSQLSSNSEFIRLQSELSVARQSLRSLTSRRTRVRDELSALDQAVVEAPAAVAGVQQLERRHDSLVDTLDELMDRRDRLDLTTKIGPGGRGVEYQVYERPQRAISPVAPPHTLLNIFVFMLAGGAGVATALGLTLIDRSFSQVDQLREAFGLPVLGALTEAPSLQIVRKRKNNLIGLASTGVALVIICGIFTYISSFRLPSELPANEAASVTTVTEQERL